MTENERKAIEENIENPEHIDYYTAWLLNHLLSLEHIIKADEFNTALKTANQTEIDTFLKVLSCLHGSLSELHKTSCDKSLHIETETAIKEHFLTIGELVEKENAEENE